MGKKFLERTFFVFLFFAVAALLFSSAVAGRSTERDLDILAEKTVSRLNAYFGFDDVAFVKSVSGPYDNRFFYAADYWNKKRLWIFSAQLNAAYTGAILSNARISNGMLVQYYGAVDILQVGFDCPAAPESQMTYFVYARASTAFANLTSFSDALTSACLDFQTAAASEQEASIVPSVAPQVEPSIAEPSEAPSAPSEVAGEFLRVAPSVAASAAASSVVAQSQSSGGDFNWVFLVVAGVIVVALVYWFVLRGNAGKGKRGGKGKSGERRKK